MWNILRALLVLACVQSAHAQVVSRTYNCTSPVSMSSMAGLGDSRSALTFDFVTTNVQSSAVIHLNWIPALLKQQFSLTGNFGVSGQNSTQILARVNTALASGPAFLAILANVNDVPAGFSTDTSFNNDVAMVQAALRCGVRPILFTDPGAENMTAAQAANFHGTGGLNDRLRAYALTDPNIILVDTVPILLQQTSPTILFKTGYSFDGVHLDTPGAFALGQAVATQLRPYLPEGNDFDMSDNVVANWNYTTATGGTPGTGNTGVLPASFTGVRDNANDSTVFSVGASANGQIPAIVGVGTFNNTAGTIGGMRLTQTLAGNPFAPGDKYRCGVQLDVDAGSTNLIDGRSELVTTYTDSSFLTGYSVEASSGRAAIGTSSALSLAFQTLPYQSDGAKTFSSISARMGLRSVGTGGGTVRVYRMWCRKAQ